jgi:hypothetical protein
VGTRNRRYEKQQRKPSEKLKIRIYTAKLEKDLLRTELGLMKKERNEEKKRPCKKKKKKT